MVEAAAATSGLRVEERCCTEIHSRQVPVSYRSVGRIVGYMSTHHTELRGTCLEVEVVVLVELKQLVNTRP